MNAEARQYSLEDLSHEQIELHIQRAHELRDEAIVNLVMTSLAGLRNAVQWAFARVRTPLNYRRDVIKVRQRTA